MRLRRLREEGELDETRRAHANYVAGFVDDADARSKLLSQREWLELVSGEFDNIRAAVDWALSDANALSLGARIVAALGMLLYSRRYQEGSQWLELAVAHIDDLEPSLAARVLVEFVRTQPLTPRALALAERAVEMYRRIDDAPGLSRALQFLGQSLINARRLEDAENVLREAIALGRRAMTMKPVRCSRKPPPCQPPPVRTAISPWLRSVTALGFCARERLALSPFRIADTIERMAEDAESQARAALSADEFARCWAEGERQDRNGMVAAIVSTK